MRGSGPVIAGVVLPKQGPSHSDFKRGLTSHALQEKVEQELLESYQQGWEPASQPQQCALECEADILLFGGSAGGLKALALDTPIPIPTGWTTMGELRVGHAVLDEQGRPCKVASLSPIHIGKKVYEVVFDDGTIIRACGDHRWQTMNEIERLRVLRQSDAWRARRRANRPSRGTGQKPWLSLRNSASAGLKTAPERGHVRTTDDLRATLRGRDGRPNHSIDIAGALQLPDAELPVDPYVLGAWLGDGHSKGAVFTTNDPDILREIETCGHVLRKYSTQYEWGISGLQKHLRLMGLLRNKHIPAAYLRASFSQRLALLQGLMDTDGSVVSQRSCIFYNTNAVLVEQVRELLLSLGIKANITSWTAKCNGKDCGPAYGIKFVADVPVFRLQRKAERQKRRERPTATRRYIVDVREVASEPTRCITVDSPSHLYLCSRSFIPTHNTESLLIDATQEIENPNLHGILFRESFPELRDIVSKSRRLYPQLGGKFTDGSPKRWTFPSGATIEFGYLGADDDVYAHQGIEYSWVGFDEAGHQNEFRIRYMLTRLRSTDTSLKLRMRLTANPGGQGHEFLFKFFLRGVCPHCTPSKAVEDGKLYTDAVWPSDKQPVSVEVEGELIEYTVAFIRSKITDHNLLGKRYVANLMQQSAATASILLDGCWKQWEGQYFNCYSETRGYEYVQGKGFIPATLKEDERDLRMVVPFQELDIKAWYAHIVAGDYGFTISKAAGVLMVRTPATPLWPNGRLYILDEFLQGGITARDYGQALIERWFLDSNGQVPEVPRNLALWAVSPDAKRLDGSVNDINVPFSRLQQMNEALVPYGFEFVLANDDRVNGWMYLYQMLRDGELVICEHCQHTRDMFLSRVRDPKKFDDLLKVSGDELDDLADAIRYGAMTWKLQGAKPRQERVAEIVKDLDPTSAAIAVQRFEKKEREGSISTATFGRRKAKTGGLNYRRPW